MDSYSKNANGLINVVKWLNGPEVAKSVVLACFAKSKSDKINEATVYAVLHEMSQPQQSEGQAN